MTDVLPKAVIIEDEHDMQKLLETLLEGNSFRTFVAGTGQEGILRVAEENPDIIVLDLGLPDINGLQVTRRIREWSKTPIIIVSAQGMESDKVEALDAGADDYLTKPFGSRELMARVRACLRRQNEVSGSDPVMTIGDLEIDLAARTAMARGVEVDLTRKEWEVLSFLCRNLGRVVTHRQILREVWGPHAANRTHYVRVQMASLRSKLERDSANPAYFKTEIGVGYRLVAEPGFD